RAPGHVGTGGIGFVFLDAKERGRVVLQHAEAAVDAPEILEQVEANLTGFGQALVAALRRRNGGVIHADSGGHGRAGQTVNDGARAKVVGDVIEIGQVGELRIEDVGDDDRGQDDVGLV